MSIRHISVFSLGIGLLTATGCAGDLKQRYAALKLSQQRYQVRVQRLAQVIGMNGRLVASKEQAVQRYKQRTAALEARLKRSSRDLRAAQAQLNVHRMRSKDTLADTKRRVITSCRSLPSNRDLARFMRKKRLRRPKILSAHRGPHQVVLVVSARLKRNGTKQIMVIRQSKTIAKPQLITLTAVPSGGDILNADIRIFMKRFVDVRLDRWEYHRKGRKTVISRHFILRPDGPRLLIACSTKGSIRHFTPASRRPSVERTVSFVPGIDAGAAGATFQISVLEAHLAGNKATPEILRVARRLQKYWTFKIGSDGTCKATRSYRKIQRHHVLDGLDG